MHACDGRRPDNGHDALCHVLPGTGCDGGRVAGVLLLEPGIGLGGGRRGFCCRHLVREPADEVSLSDPGFGRSIPGILPSSLTLRRHDSGSAREPENRKIWRPLVV